MLTLRSRPALILVVSFISLGSLGTSCPVDDPAELGPYPVGRTTILVPDPEREARVLPVDVWYPAVDDGRTPPSEYDLIFASIASDVALDNPPLQGGRFALLVFSHGNNAVRFQSIFLQEHLASHGFIVVAPDHVGNTAADALNPVPPPFEAKDRPLDISLVIDAMLAANADASSPFHERVDDHRIGVLGHSFGAFTTLAMISGFQDVEPDNRISAIMPIAPAARSLTDAELAEVDVPTFVLSGTLDTITPVEPNTRRTFEETSGRPRFRVDIQGAGHNSFTSVCAFFDALDGVGLPPPLLDILVGNVEQGCAPELIPIEEAHRITKIYATSFFKTKLEGNIGFVPFLTRIFVRKTGLPVDYDRATR